MRPSDFHRAVSDLRRAAEQAGEDIGKIETSYLEVLAEGGLNPDGEGRRLMTDFTRLLTTAMTDGWTPELECDWLLHLDSLLQMLRETLAEGDLKDDHLLAIIHLLRGIGEAINGFEGAADG